MNLSIDEIAKACGGKLVLQGASGERLVDSVALDSRKVTPGGVFVATVGERVDGHRFIRETYDKGVILAITEKTPEQMQEEWGSYLLVESSLQALKSLAEYYRCKLQIPIVGITGSVGKTSTKEAIATVLAEKYKVLKTEGNLNNEIGVPLTLLRIREETEAAVIEMGISEFGEMHRLSKMARPSVCVITNIGQCHLENLKSRDGILHAKTEIFDYMQPDGEVCLNGEDDKLCALKTVQRGACFHGEEGAGKTYCPHFFGLGNNLSEEVYAADIVSRGLRGSSARLCLGQGEEIQVEIPLPGAHTVMNAAAAACVAKLLGLDHEQIAAGISKMSTIAGRDNILWLERYTLIDDCYNANPVSMRAAIDLLAMAEGEKVAVLGDMFELGEDSDALHAEVGAYAAKAGLQRIICVGENARFLYQGALKELQACAAASAPADEHIVAASAAVIGAQAPQILYYANLDSLMTQLSENRKALIPDGAAVLIKASHGMQFARLVKALQE